MVVRLPLRVSCRLGSAMNQCGPQSLFGEVEVLNTGSLLFLVVLLVSVLVSACSYLNSFRNQVYVPRSLLFSAGALKHSASSHWASGHRLGNRPNNTVLYTGVFRWHSSHLGSGTLACDELAHCIHATRYRFVHTAELSLLFLALRDVRWY